MEGILFVIDQLGRTLSGQRDEIAALRAEIARLTAPPAEPTSP